MKKILIFLALVIGVIGFSASNAKAYVSVKGYYKSNGTYVAPHVRSDPNGLKYDNYSYTPSQGLYNKTYGTRGSTWDTPTYFTDPDYYVGKSLYESGNYSFSGDLKIGSSSSEVSVLQKRLGVLPVTGYFGKLTKNALIKYQKENYIYPASGTLDFATRAKLNAKPIVDPLKMDQSCTATFGLNSYFNGQINDKGGATCDCKSGYKFNSSLTSCIANEANWCQLNNPGEFVEVNKYPDGNFSCTCYSSSDVNNRSQNSCKKPIY